MNNILNHINEFKFLYLIILVIIFLLVILLIILKKKNNRVEPITIEEIEKKAEPSPLEEVIAAMESNVNDRRMTTFEQEQEENAIISYQELVKAVNEKKAKNNIKIDKKTNDIDNENIDEESTIEQIIEEMSENNIIEEDGPEEIIKNDIIEEDGPEEIIKNDIIEDSIEKLIEEKVESKKFKSSEFISPVYGKDRNKTNDDFLKELKDFRNNL